MENQATQDGNEHFEFLGFVLSVFDKTLHNIVALLNDNAGTNLSIARKFGSLYNDCDNHWFNFAVQDNVKVQKVKIAKAQLLMEKLLFNKLAALICRHSRFRAKTENVTRRISTFEM